MDDDEYADSWEDDRICSYPCEFCGEEDDYDFDEDEEENE